MLRQKLTIAVLAVSSLMFDHSLQAQQARPAGNPPARTPSPPAQPAQPQRPAAPIGSAPQTPATNGPGSVTPPVGSAPQTPATNGPGSVAPPVGSAPQTPTARAPAQPGSARRGTTHDGDHDRNGRRTPVIPGWYYPFYGYGYNGWGGWGDAGWDIPDSSNPYPDRSVNDPVGSSGNTPSNQPTLPPLRMPTLPDGMTADQMQKMLEASPEYQSALIEARDASVAYDAAMDKARAKLEGTAQYQQAIGKKQADDQRIEAVRDAQGEQAGAPATRPSTISPEVVRAAEKKLNDAREVTRIESQEAATDPEVKAAKDRLAAATERLNVMKKQIEAARQTR